MKKLLKLTTKHFLSGISATEHIENGGIFNSTTAGCSPIYFDKASIGLLGPGPAANNTGGAAVVDTIIAGAVNSSGGTTKLFSLGASGHFYSHDVSSADATPTDLRSGTPITTPANGMEVYQTAGGTRYLYYWQKTQIGQWDLAGAYATGWDDAWATGLDSTFIHPTHKFLDRIYYGNGNKLGAITDNAGTPTHNANVLDFPSDYYTTSLSDDGTYVIVALNRQSVSGTPTSTTGAKILFWDMISASWIKEWNIPDSTGISSIRTVNGITYILETNRLSYCTFATPPTNIKYLAGNLRPSFDGNASGSADHQRMIKYSDGVLWLTGAVTLAYYGKYIPEVPRALHVPFAGLTSASSILPIATTSRLYVGGASKYYSVPTITGTATGISAKTFYIPLKTETKIGRIDIIFGKKLASGDSLLVDVRTDESEADSTNGTTWGTASFALHGAVQRVKLFNTKSAENLKINLTFNGGTPLIKGIEVFGDPTI